jgi:hypothetical protein
VLILCIECVPVSQVVLLRKKEQVVTKEDEDFEKEFAKVPNPKPETLNPKDFEKEFAKVSFDRLLFRSFCFHKLSSRISRP